MHYYKVLGRPAFSFESTDKYEAISEEECQNLLKDDENVLLFLTKTSKEKRTSFSITSQELLFTDPDNLSFIRKTDIQDERVKDVPQWIQDAMQKRNVRYMNMANESFTNVLEIPKKGKWRINIVGLGDIGSNVLLGLKIMGGDYISEIGVYSTKSNMMERYEMELNQIYSINENSPLYSGKPVIKTVDKDSIMDCDMFVFCASSKVPSISAELGEDRTQQLAANKEILRKYINKARNMSFKGVFAIVSDPVEQLCKEAYLMSNTDKNGNLDYKGMMPEQIQGFGLGIMYARALYYANKMKGENNFRENGRVYGTNGRGVVIANDIHNYDEQISEDLTQKAADAKHMLKDLGFKPYIAPAMSSAVLSIISRIAGDYHYSSVYIDGAYLGIKNRASLSGIEVERVSMDDTLFNKIKKTHDRLKNC